MNDDFSFDGEAPDFSAFGSPVDMAPTSPRLPKGMTADDFDHVVRTVYGEAAGEPELGQQAVAAVIANRARQSGKTHTDVVKAPWQFEPWMTRRGELESLDPASDKYQRIAKSIFPVLNGELDDPTGGATHFYSPRAQRALGRAAPTWDNGSGVDLGNHRFFNLGYGGKGPHGIPQQTAATKPAVLPGRSALGGPSPDAGDGEEGPDLWSLKADPETDDDTPALPDDEAAGEAPMYLGGPGAKPDFSAFGTPVSGASEKKAKGPDFSALGTRVEAEKPFPDGKGNGIVENIFNPQQYKELAKGVIPGAISMQGSALQGVDAAVARGQYGARDFGKKQLAAMDQIDRGEPVAETDDPMGYQHMGAEDRKAARAELEKAQKAFNPTPIQERPLYKAGQAVQDWSKDLAPFKAAPGYEQSTGRQLGEGLGSMVGGLPYAMVGAIPAGIFFGASGAGEATQRAVEYDKKERKEGRPGLSQEQIAIAGVMGIAPGTTDLLPLEVLLGRLPLPVPPGLRGTLAQAIGRIGGQAFVEGLQEGGQQFLQNLIAQQVYNPDQKLGDEVLGNTGIGAGVGAIAQGGKEVGSALLRRRGARGHTPATETEEPSQIEGPQKSLPAPATPPPASADETGWLRARGYSDEAIAQMGPDERAAEIEDAKAQGLKPVPVEKAPDAPTAEPVSDLVAQARDFANPKNDREGVYLPAPSLEVLRADEKGAEEFVKALGDNHVVLNDFDGKGGALIVPNDALATVVEQAKKNGRDVQEIIGHLTGAGRGKPANGSVVVQQRDKAGNVTRETLTTPEGVAQAKKDLAAPGRTVVEVSPEEAIQRREQMIAGKPQGTRSAPVDIQSADDVASATAPPDYSPAQGEANNRRLGHAKWNGLDISIETDADNVRRGQTKEGRKWKSRMGAPYGYFKNTLGADDMHVDVFVGPNPASDKVYVLDENDKKTGKFRQHKTFIGFDSEADARQAYASSSNKSEDQIGGITEMGVDEFKDWLADGKKTKPAAKPEKARYEGPELSPDEVDLIISNWNYVRDVQAMPKPQTLAQFVIAAGGLRDDAREVRHIMGAAKERPGLINKRGATLDDMALSAWESGFFEGSERPTIAEFLDKLQDDLHTGAEVRAQDYEAQESIRIAAQIAEELNDYGVTANQFRSEASLREYLGQERASPAGAPARTESQEAAEAPEAVVAGGNAEGQQGRRDAQGVEPAPRERDGGIRDTEDTYERGTEPAENSNDTVKDRGSGRDGSGERGSGVDGARETGPSDSKPSRLGKGLGDLMGKSGGQAKAVERMVSKETADALQKGKEQARKYVLDRGKRAEKEFGAMVLPDGSMKPNKVSGTENFLRVDQETAPDLWTGPAKSVDFHHNHPKSTSFSRADYTEAAPRPALRRTWVHGHDGSEYWAEFKADGATIGRGYDIARTMTEKALTKKGQQTFRYRGHLIAEMLRDAGLIGYGATLAPADAAKRIKALKEQIGAERWADTVEDIANLKERANGVLDRGAGPAGRQQGDVGGASGEAAQTRPDEAGSEGGRETGQEGAGSVDASPLEALSEQLRTKGFKTIIEARKAAQALGFTGTNKQIDEIIETAVVAAAREIASDGIVAEAQGDSNQRATYDALVDLYGKQPNLASRTGTSVANQAYSTPVPLAYVASRLARVVAADHVLEPTAGNGVLLIEAGFGRDTVFANELDPARAAALKEQGFNVKSEDASAPGLVTPKSADAVIMNPPFGAVKEGGKSRVFDVDGWKTTQIDHAIALQTLKAMTDDGHAVLILGGTKSEATAERRKDYRGKAKREFYARLYKQYNVTDHFTVSGDLYTKQGASWPVDVIVIEGRGQSERKLPAAEPPAILKSWDDLAEKLPNEAGRNELEARSTDRPARKPSAERTEPAERDGSDKPAPVGRGAERVQPEAEGKPAAVRPERNQGEPGDVGRGGGSVAAEPAVARDSGRTDQPVVAQPVRPRVKREAPKGGQAFYEPTSAAQSLDTLIPVNMAAPARDAMAKVEKRRGSVDKLVADRLGYDPNELSQYFSAEQVDALAAAIDNVERGAAMIVGDQTGIGKGRIAAGMLRYAMKKGMTPVFLTEKPDLYGDMYRDLRDIGVPEMLGREPRMFITNAGETITLDEDALAWKQESEEARRNGEPAPKRRGKFLVGGTAAKVQENMKKIANGDDIADVIFTTYDQMNTVKGQDTPRRKFLAQIAPQAMIVMDEAHNAGGQAKTGWEKKDAPMNRADFARELAAKAKGVMFSSATYAKRPDVMDLYARTDMGKAVDDPKDLPELIQRGGVPMQQIVASMLAQSGQYLRRERSFDGVNYDLTPVPVDERAYKQFSSAMQAIFRFDLEVEEFRKQWGEDKLDEMGFAKSRDEGVGSGSASSISFGSLMHNITNQMLLAIKAEATAQQAIKAHKAGEKPVIALANTNESFIKDFAEGEGIKAGQPLDLNFSAVLERYLQRTLRITVKSPEGDRTHLQIPLNDLPTSMRQEYQEAMNQIKAGKWDSLPISPIDHIRHRLGEAGISVREVTGRQTMIDYSKPVPTYTQRPKSEMGASGKRGSIAAFNAGRLDALILNRSGSTGVSMHASKDFKDQRKRRMILAQAEGNIDTHLQMLGRVHRTGQVIAPAYSQIAAEIPAEARPTAVLMKKMASLNANTTGARSSAFTVESVDFINEVGDKVVADILLEDPELNEKLGEPLTFDDKTKSPKIEDVARKATGRLVLLDPEVQAKFLDQVQKAYVAEVEQLDALGENPLEAKTVDLQAKTVDTSELKPTQGDSPFLDAVRLEKVTAKAQGRAMPPAEVAGKVAEFLKGRKPESAPAQALAAVEAQGRTWKDAEVARVSSLIRQQMAQEIAETKPENKETTRRRLEAQYQRWTDTMAVAYPGARVTLGMSAGDVQGVVTSVERTGKAKQMGALGSWTVKIAVADSMRQLEFPMSKLFPPGATKGEDEKGATIGRSSISHSDLVQQFEDARREGRETRYIVTGNILGGFDQTRGRGRIVNYTTESGELRPGILMGREFSAEKFMDSRAVRFQNAGQITEFIDKAPLAKVESKVGDIELSSYRGEYRIEMSSARAKAGQFFTDKAVRSAIGAGNEFQKRGTKMVADGLTQAQFARAIAEMQKIGAKFEVRDQQDLAQSIVAKRSGFEEESEYPRFNKAGFELRLPFKAWGNPRFNPQDRAHALDRLREIQTMPVRTVPWSELVEARRDIQQITANLFYYAPDMKDADIVQHSDEVFWYVKDPHRTEKGPESERPNFFRDGGLPEDLTEFATQGKQAIDHMMSVRRAGVPNLMLWGAGSELAPEPRQRNKPDPTKVGDKMRSGFYFMAGRKLSEAPDFLFNMNGQAVINWLMKNGVTREEINHFRLQEKFGQKPNEPRPPKVSRAEFQKAIAERMFDFRRKVSWLNPERSKKDYEMGGTRAFRGPRIPGRGIYFENLVAFPKKLKGGEAFAPGEFVSPHWEEELKNAWASWRGSVREVPGWGKMVVGEEGQSDFMQGANSGRRPRISGAEWAAKKKDMADYEKVMEKADNLASDVLLSVYGWGSERAGMREAMLHDLVPTKGREYDLETWQGAIDRLKKAVFERYESLDSPTRDFRRTVQLNEQIAQLEALRTENERFFAPGAMRAFRGEIAESYTPESPLDRRYTRTMVRDLLLHAAKENADSVAISTTETNDRIQINTFRSAGHFYDAQLAPSLERELRDLTGNHKLTLEKVALPKAQGAPRNEKAYTVWAAKLPPEVLADIRANGLRVMAVGSDLEEAGVPKRTDFKSAIPDIRRAMGSILKSGRPVSINGAVVTAIHKAVDEVRGMVPAGANVYALSRVEPTEEPGTVIAVFEDQHGNEYPLTESWNYLSGIRAAYFEGNIFLVRLSPRSLRDVGEFNSGVAAELGHEVAHALRWSGRLDGVTWDRLLAHAKALRLLDGEFGTYLKIVGDPSADKVADVTTREIYERLYNTRSNRAELMDQEEVAHLVEWYMRGLLSRAEVEPVMDILDDILAGRVQSAEREDSLEREMAFALAKTGREQRRDLDALGYFSQALEAAKGLKQAKGTPEQMLKMVMDAAGAGAKSEIAATGLAEFVAGKKRVTQDEIVQYEGGRQKWIPPKHPPIPFHTFPLTEAVKDSVLEDGQPMFAIAGVKAKGAPLSSRNLAESMERKGRKPDQILKDTGWFRGPDQKWRFEIDDSKAALKNLDAKLAKPQNSVWRALSGKRAPGLPAWAGTDVRLGLNLSLPDVLTHDKLFKAYPFLNKMRVSIVVGPGVPASQEGGALMFRRANGGIVYDPIQIKARTQADILPTLMHELQHYIQQKEGFAEGSNTSGRPDLKVKPLNYDMAPSDQIVVSGETFSTTTRRALGDGLSNRRTSWRDQIAGINNAESLALSIADIWDGIRKLDGGDKHISLDMTTQSVIGALVNHENEKAYEAYKRSGLSKEYLQKYALPRLQAELMNSLRVSAEDYLSSAGEAEANAVMDRLSYTPEQRRTMLLSYGPSKNIGLTSTDFRQVADTVLESARRSNAIREKWLQEPVQLGNGIAVFRPEENALAFVLEKNFGWRNEITAALDWKNGRAFLQFDHDAMNGKEFGTSDEAPGALTDKELALVADAAEAYVRSLNLLPTADPRLVPNAEKITGLVVSPDTGSGLSEKEIAFWKNRDPFFEITPPVTTVTHHDVLNWALSLDEGELPRLLEPGLRERLDRAIAEHGDDAEMSPDDRREAVRIGGKAIQEALHNTANLSDAYYEIIDNGPVTPDVIRNKNDLRDLLTSAYRQSQNAAAGALELPMPADYVSANLDPEQWRIRDREAHQERASGSLIPRISTEQQADLSASISEAINIVNRIAGQTVSVRFQDTIGADGLVSDVQREATEEAGFRSETLGGFYKPASLDAGAIIGLATKDPKFDLLTTAGHEAWHHVETALASPAELRLLTSAPEMRRMRTKAGEEIGLAAGDPRLDAIPEAEIRAIAFQKYRREREEGLQPQGIHIGVRRFWDRILKIFAVVRNAMGGHGFKTYEDVFERARTGEIASKRSQRFSPADVETIVTAWQDLQEALSGLPLSGAQVQPVEGSPILSRSEATEKVIAAARQYKRPGSDEIPTSLNVPAIDKNAGFSWRKLRYYSDKGPLLDAAAELAARVRDGSVKSTIQNVPIAALRTPQKNVSASQVAYKINRSDLSHEPRLPIVVRGRDGSFTIHDGNHRVQARAYRGFSHIRAHVIDEQSVLGFKSLLPPDWGNVHAHEVPVNLVDPVSTEVLGSDPNAVPVLRYDPNAHRFTVIDGGRRFMAERASGKRLVSADVIYDRPWHHRLFGVQDAEVRGLANVLAQEIEKHGINLDAATDEATLRAQLGGPPARQYREGEGDQAGRAEGLEPPLPTSTNRDTVGQNEGASAPSGVSGDPDVLASLIPRAIQQSVNQSLNRLQPRLDRVRVGLQDKFLPVRRIQEEKERQTGTRIPINLDTYVAEALFHGRAGEQTADLKTDFVEPLVDILRKADISKDQFDDYLYARHARERNDAIALIDPSNTAGSGMTNQEADAILIAARSKQASYDAAAKLVDTMLEETRKRLLRAGLIDRETFDQWQSQYAHYVPLRGWESGSEEAGRSNTGRGFDIRGPEARQALGRRSKADSPLAYAIEQATTSIVRAEKNRVDKTLYRFIQAYPDPALYRVYTGEARRRVNPSTGLIETYWVPPAFVRDDAIHGVKIGGKQYYMELKDAGLARAMRGVQGEQHNAVLRGMMWLSRTYASLLTSYNPEFVVSNFFRDIQTALANVTDVADKPAGIRAQMLKEAASFKTMRGVMAALYGHEGRTIFGTKRAADETFLGTKRSAGAQDYARWFEEYRQAGGKISFMEYNDVERIQSDINSLVNRGRFMAVTKKAASLINDLNTAVENGVRLSTYIAMRKGGISQDRAAFVARELTVNFNRKGEWSPVINSMYLFFNASVQGTTRMAQAIMRSRTLQVGVASIAGMAFMVDWWNYLIAGDDDDGKNRYDKIQNWIKERNLIIMTGRKDGSYFQIPMPYGYNLFWSAGQHTGAVIRGSEKPHQAAIRMASSMLDVLSPIGGANINPDGEKWTVAQMLAPTMVDPFIQVIENKTWYGGPIYPTKFNKNQPNSETFFSSAPSWAIDMARTLNRITGGNSARSGTIDVSPEVLQHFFEFAGGGVAKFIGNVGNTANRAYNGQEWLPEKTPFVRRVYGKATTESRRRDFYKEWDEVDAAKYEVDNLIKNLRPGAKGQASRDEIAAAREKYAVELQAYEGMKAAQRQLAAMRKQRTEIELNRTLSSKEKEERLQEIINRENGLVLRSLGTLNRLRKQAKQPKDRAPETVE